MTQLTYALERLYADQDHDFVVDTIPAVLAWVPPRKSRKKKGPPYRLGLHHVVGDHVDEHRLELGWDIEALKARDPDVEAHSRRLRTGRTAQREHVTELAAYGLSFVAISLLMPGRRIVAMSEWRAPDLLFDVTPGRLKGVETAGRTRGGLGALRRVRNGTARVEGKHAQLRARVDLVEAHLSLWSASAPVGLLEQVKP